VEIFCWAIFWISLSGVQVSSCEKKKGYLAFLIKLCVKSFELFTVQSNKKGKL